MVKGWHGWVGTFNGVALITVAVLPLAALAVWALARRRSVTGTTPAWAWRILALAAGCSVLVEAAQYLLRLDRVSSVDDVLLNAAGAGLAALASRRWWSAKAVARVAAP